LRICRRRRLPPPRRRRRGRKRSSSRSRANSLLLPEVRAERVPLAVEAEVAEVDSEVTVEVPTDPEVVLLEVDVAVPETTLRRPRSPSTTSRPSPLWEPKRAVTP
jgi:hypothetical protein